MTSTWTATRSDRSLTGLYAVRSPDAPASVGHTDPNIVRLADHLVVAVDNFELANFIAQAHNHLDNLDDGPTWEALRLALAAFDACRNELGAGIIPESLTGLPDADQSAWVIRASFKAISGQVVHRRVGVALRGDGSSPEVDVHAICTLPSVIRRRLSETRDVVVAVRQIAQETIVMDATVVAMFDAADWRADGADIVRRSDNRRLADLLAGTDGVWNRATATTTTGITKGSALDFRKHRLVVRPTAAEVRDIHMPPQVLEALRDAARAHGGDLGRTIAAMMETAA